MLEQGHIKLVDLKTNTTTNLVGFGDIKDVSLNVEHVR